MQKSILSSALCCKNIYETWKKTDLRQETWNMHSVCVDERIITNSEKNKTFN